MRPFLYRPVIGTALLVVAAPVLLTGMVAWVFPNQALDLGGAWAFPTLALSALLLAVGLSVEWQWLRGLIPVLAFTLVLGWNPSSTTSTSHFAGASFGLLAMLAAGRMIGTPRLLRIAVMVFLVGGLALLLVGLAGSTARMGTLIDSISPVELPRFELGLVGLPPGGDVNPNALAAATLLIVPLAVSLLLGRTFERFDRLVLFPLALIVTLTGTLILAITHSRSAWIAIWLVLVGLLVRGIKSGPWRVVTGTMVLAPLFLAVFAVLLLNQESFMREAGNSWSSARVRAQIMAQGVEQWRESPWRGIGLNEFRTVHSPKAGEITTDEDIAHAHNIFLQTALDVGLVGSAALWAIIGLLLVRARQAARGVSRLARSVAAGSALALVTIALFGLTDAVSLGSKVGTLQWIVGGLILASWRTGCPKHQAVASDRFENALGGNPR